MSERIYVHKILLCHWILSSVVEIIAIALRGGDTLFSAYVS
jgi:hypothetical protein